MNYKVLPHTADLRLKVFGRTKKELFCHALKGMFESLNPDTSQCRRRKGSFICDDLPQKHFIKIKSSDFNSLLVDFLSEALYLSDINDEAYFKADISKLTEKEIEATIKGVKIKGFEEGEIKAVTHHEVDIKWVAGSWETVIVFDI